MTPPLATGTHYGQYEILDHVGEGAFSHVYRVRAPGIERPVALKLSHDILQRSQEAKRFLREVAILRTLSSSHVVRVHDSGYGPDGRIFILMELLSGTQLDRFHPFGRPMAPPRALTLVLQACLGLGQAHALGIVHRDLKPENLWVDDRRRVKVIDFGLARAWDTVGTIGTNVTLGRVLVGTPHYMQPEQMHTSKLTPASDVYSLGLILYELLTGRTPFFPDAPLPEVRERLRDDPRAWVQAHMNVQPTSLGDHRLAHELPPQIVRVVDRCLAKAPAHRPADAGVLSRELGSILHYEFGALLAATLRVTHPYGGYEDFLLLPGAHRIGSAPECQIALRGADIEPLHALLEWSGLGAPPTLHTLVDDESVQVALRPIRGAALLRSDDTFTIGPYGLTIFYPDMNPDLFSSGESSS